MIDSEIPTTDVRSIISIFENIEPLPKGKPNLRLSKSFSRSQTSIRYQEPKSPRLFKYDFANQDLIAIERKLEEMRKEINNYDSYSKNQHAYYQIQLVAILSEIVNIEGNQEGISKKKRELILVIQMCNKILTRKLPNQVNEGNKIHQPTVNGIINPKTKLSFETSHNVDKTQVQSNENKNSFISHEEFGVIKSVKSLRSIFEQKSPRNDQLNQRRSVNEIEFRKREVKDFERRNMNEKSKDIPQRYSLDGNYLRYSSLLNKKDNSNGVPQTKDTQVENTIINNSPQEFEEIPDVDVSNIVNTIEGKLSKDETDDHIFSSQQEVLVCEPIQRTSSVVNEEIREEVGDVNVLDLIRKIEHGDLNSTAEEKNDKNSESEESGTSSDTMVQENIEINSEDGKMGKNFEENEEENNYREGNFFEIENEFLENSSDAREDDYYQENNPEPDY